MRMEKSNPGCVKKNLAQLADCPTDPCAPSFEQIATISDVQELVAVRNFFI